MQVELPQQPPEGWFVRFWSNERGHVTVETVLANAPDNPACQAYREFVPQKLPWWRFPRPFPVRLERAVSRARKQAYLLNQQVALARQQIYRLERSNG